MSDHCLIQVKLEAVLTQRVEIPTLEPEEIDHRSLPQTTIRKVIKKCLDNAALVNYERLSQEAKIEGSVFDADNNVTKKLSIFSKVATEVFMF